jgi:uncharacterized protein (TIGR02996 family)
MQDLGEKLLAKIVANPDDNTARGDYAKWLTANGDIRGEAMTLMLKKKLDDKGQKRLNVIFEQASTAIEADIIKYGGIAFIERGMVECIAVEPATLVKHGERWFAQHPITRIELSQWEKKLGSSLATLAKAKFLSSKIRELELDVSVKDFSPLWNGAFTALQHLELAAVGCKVAPKTLTGIGKLRAPKLHTIRFYCVEGAERALESLAASTSLPALKRIEVDPGSAGDHDEQVFTIASLRKQFASPKKVRAK